MQQLCALQHNVKAFHTRLKYVRSGALNEPMTKSIKLAASNASHLMIRPSIFILHRSILMQLPPGRFHRLNLLHLILQQMNHRPVLAALATGPPSTHLDFLFLRADLFE